MFEKLVKKISEKFSQLQDSRKKSPNTTYGIKEAVLSAFSVFFMQYPSFHAHQRDGKRKKGQSNAQSLFGEHQRPSDNQIRNLLDPLNPEQLDECFWWVYEELEAAKGLEPYKGIEGSQLCALDGVTYFSSQTISCKQCKQQVHSNGTITYTHSAIAPVLVAPGVAEVISLSPELIQRQDGAEKQDCEQNAMKRWIVRNASHFAPYSLTILTDDLHCHQPLCALCRTHKLHFILVCLPDSHKTLYEEIALLEKINAVHQLVHRFWNGRFHERWSYRYVNALSIRTGEEAEQVNWCELTILNEQTGEILYRIAFATDFYLTAHNLPLVVRSGRARWKTENENHNVLKNHGYHLEHNFGHGHLYLAAFLFSLNLLSFLLHTLLHLSDSLFQRLRLELGSRRTFFDDLRTLTRYLRFDSLSHLLSFMADNLDLASSP